MPENGLFVNNFKGFLQKDPYTLVNMTVSDRVISPPPREGSMRSREVMRLRDINIQIHLRWIMIASDTVEEAKRCIKEELRYMLEPYVVFVVNPKDGSRSMHVTVLDPRGRLIDA